MRGLLCVRHMASLRIAIGKEGLGSSADLPSGKQAKKSCSSQVQGEGDRVFRSFQLHTLYVSQPVCRDGLRPGTRCDPARVDLANTKR
jgi:hypothetical protein